MYIPATDNGTASVVGGVVVVPVFVGQPIQRTSIVAQAAGDTRLSAVLTNYPAGGSLFPLPLDFSNVVAPDIETFMPGDLVNITVGDVTKSGGIGTNIGIHFFDMLLWVFGNVRSNVVHAHNQHFAAGVLELERARVRWFLSISFEHIPENVRSTGKRTFRSITMEGEEVEFSEGFTDLHTISYENIIAGSGYGLDDAAPAIQVAHDIRHAEVLGKVGDFHPLLQNAQ
jgi:hypothetical protein